MPSEHEHAAARRVDERPSPPLRAVVAVPVRNEAERIGACLRALCGQEGIEAGSLGIVLFLNNCTDGTAREIAAHHPPSRVLVRIIARHFAGAHAGWARREAMEAAASWLEEDGAPDGVILTTDADSRVPPDWVSRNLAALAAGASGASGAAGADAVAGRIALDPGAEARLPPALRARGRLEGVYGALLTELSARADPRAHDPWPCHWTASGASLALRLAAYRRIGGIPASPVGEDGALVERLLAFDGRVRHAPDITVVNSGRLDGRAPGGAADTMRLRCAMPDSPCDERLEPVWRALFRYLWRRRLRRLHAAGTLPRIGLWAPFLGVERAEARSIATLGGAGEVLARVERVSPRLAWKPLRPRDLPSQIRLARMLLGLVRRTSRRRRSPRSAGLGGTSVGGRALGAGDAVAAP